MRGVLTGIVLTAALTGPVAAQRANYTLYRDGSATNATVTTTPLLVLQGGGREADSAFALFKQAANGGDIVVLRASGSDGYHPYLMNDLPGPRPDSVETIVFNRRQASFDASVQSIIANADALLLAGGDQSDYDASWRGTPVEDLINAHAAAGKPLAGTSAGLAVLGSTAYVARNGSAVSSDALANPYHPDITLEHDFLTVPFLGSLVTDSHFADRDRQGRLLAFTGRMLADGVAAPVAFGLGIDEGVAVTVDGRGVGTVHAPSGGAAYFLRAGGDASGVAANTPLTLDPVGVLVAGAGDTINLPRFDGHQVARRFWTVTSGAWSSANAALGDVDLSGDRNPADLDRLARRLGAVGGTPAFDPWFDFNADQQINLGDAAHFLALVGTTAGDADLNGVVDGTDAEALRAAFTGRLAAQPGDGPGWAGGDFDLDGDVDLDDALILRRNFTAGDAAGEAALRGLPEPGAAGLLTLGALWGVRRRRCR